MKTLLRYTWGGYIKHQGGRDGGDGAEQEGRKKLKRREGRNGTEERMIGTLKRGLVVVLEWVRTGGRAKTKTRRL
jgi:hypothetical protein